MNINQIIVGTQVFDRDLHENKLAVKCTVISVNEKEVIVQENMKVGSAPQLRIRYSIDEAKQFLNER